MRFRVEFLFFFFIGVSSRLRLRHRAALKKAATDFNARAERVSPISLSFSLSKTIKVVFFCGSLRRRPSQKSEKKESTVSRVFVFLCQNRHEKDPKNEKNLTTFTLTLTTTTNDNIKTVWRAWMNSKSPKAEETKGTEI